MKEEKPQLKRIKRELAYKGSIMKIYRDDMQMPNGKIVEWDYFHHNGGACVIPVMNDGKIIMIKQYRNALDRFTLEVPAGAFDYEGEPAIDCAKRELEEETGYKSEKIEYLLDINSMPAFTNEKVTVFIATDLVKTHQELDEQEFLEVEFRDIDNLIELIYNGVITDSKTVAALLAYKLKLVNNKL